MTPSLLRGVRKSCDEHPARQRVERMRPKVTGVLAEVLDGLDELRLCGVRTDVEDVDLVVVEPARPELLAIVGESHVMGFPAFPDRDAVDRLAVLGRLRIHVDRHELVGPVADTSTPSVHTCMKSSCPLMRPVMYGELHVSSASAMPETSSTSRGSANGCSSELLEVVPQVRIERTTCRLQGGCSTTELLRLPLPLTPSRLCSGRRTVACSRSNGDRPAAGSRADRNRWFFSRATRARCKSARRRDRRASRPSMIPARHAHRRCPADPRSPDGRHRARSHQPFAFAPSRRGWSPALRTESAASAAPAGSLKSPTEIVVDPGAESVTT